MVLAGEGKFDMFYMTGPRAKQETQSDNGGRGVCFFQVEFDTAVLATKKTFLGGLFLP